MNHKQLDAWKLSISFVTIIYKLTETFPRREQYSLINQIRRSAVSIPSNIAEGAARSSDKEFIRFLHISLGSLSELETQLIIANNLNYFDDPEAFLNEIKRIRKMLSGLIRYVKRKS